MRISMNDSSPAVKTKCGKPAGNYIPRWQMYFACVLPVGHEGCCKKGGTCFTHGDYVGSNCPEWPNCHHEILNAWKTLSMPE